MKQLVPHTLQTGPSQSGSYILFLLEPDSNRQIPIIIGAHEAQSILIAMQGLKPRRPMTHELMVSVMETYGIGLQQVVIDHVSEGIFYSTLHLTDGINLHTIDSRTTDAIALALLFQVPIMAEERVIEETAISQPNQQETTPSLKQLQDELQRCEEAEDYEHAAEIQQQIDNIKRNEH